MKLDNKQLEVIARRMGYTGPMHKFSEFLVSSPKRANMATGGLVTYSGGNTSRHIAAQNPRKKSSSKGQPSPAPSTGSISPNNTTKAGPTPTGPSGPISPNDISPNDAVGPMPQGPVAQVDVIGMQEGQGTIVDPNSGQLTGPTPNPQQTLGRARLASQPGGITTSIVDPALSAEGVEGVIDQYQYAQGTVADESTVQGQLANLMQDFEEGTPAWAAGALRNANASMAARGLGSSSMAGAATTQAAMEAAIPIAAADAQTHFQMQMQNLSNEQQVLVQANEARTQAFFTDVATENATRQFNAANENQTKQFNANLRAQVDQFNSSQMNAMSQFNAGQSNAMSTFKAEMQNQRQQFNASNRLIIDQANAKWRQQISTIDNANANEAARLGAQLSMQSGLAEMNNLFQARRDAIAFAFTASENGQNRALELFLAEMAVDEASSVRRQGSRDALWGAVGSFIAELF